MISSFAVAASVLVALSECRGFERDESTPGIIRLPVLAKVSRFLNQVCVYLEGIRCWLVVLGV